MAPSTLSWPPLWAVLSLLQGEMTANCSSLCPWQDLPSVKGSWLALLTVSLGKTSSRDSSKGNDLVWVWDNSVGLAQCQRGPRMSGSLRGRWWREPLPLPRPTPPILLRAWSRVHTSTCTQSQELFLGSQCKAFTLAQTSGLRVREANVEVKQADSETDGRFFIGGLCHRWLCPGRGRGKGLRQEDGSRSQPDSGPDLSWATSAHVVVT